MVDLSVPQRAAKENRRNKDMGMAKKKEADALDSLSDVNPDDDLDFAGFLEGLGDAPKSLGESGEASPLETPFRGRMSSDPEVRKRQGQREDLNGDRYNAPEEQSAIDGNGPRLRASNVPSFGEMLERLGERELDETTNDAMDKKLKSRLEAMDGEQINAMYGKITGREGKGSANKDALESMRNYLYKNLTWTVPKGADEEA